MLEVTSSQAFLFRVCYVQFCYYRSLPLCLLCSDGRAGSYLSQLCTLCLQSLFLCCPPTLGVAILTPLTEFHPLNEGGVCSLGEGEPVHACVSDSFSKALQLFIWLILFSTILSSISGL